MAEKITNLFLVGNGFDIAHGLKSSFKDFLISYLSEGIKSCIQLGKEYSDDNMSLNNTRLPPNHPLEPIKSPNRFIEICRKKGLN